jgi:hypothetical protein
MQVRRRAQSRSTTRHVRRHCSRGRKGRWGRHPCHLSWKSTMRSSLTMPPMMPSISSWFTLLP